jgi:SrtB family sortase
VGWLVSEGTPLSHPIVQGADNNRYLRRLYDGTKGKAGCPFLDFENSPDFTDRNSIIYGHNLLDGSMFSSLTGYRSQRYFDAHPSMLLLTPDGTFRMEIFSVFTAKPNESGAETSPWRQTWDSEEDFNAWLTQVQNRSVIKSGVKPDAKDKVLTLSTCIGGGKNRLIVMGRLVPAE